MQRSQWKSLGFGNSKGKAVKGIITTMDQMQYTIKKIEFTILMHRSKWNGAAFAAAHERITEMAMEQMVITKDPTLVQHELM